MTKRKYFTLFHMVQHRIESTHIDAHALNFVHTIMKFDGLSGWNWWVHLFCFVVFLCFGHYPWNDETLWNDLISVIMPHIGNSTITTDLLLLLLLIFSYILQTRRFNFIATEFHRLIECVQFSDEIRIAHDQDEHIQQQSQTCQRSVKL